MGNKLKINIQNFRYDKEGQLIFPDFRLNAEDGDIVMIEGPVGCGKTTLLKVMSGIIPNFEEGFFKSNMTLNGIEIGKGTFSLTAFCFQDSDNQLLFDTVGRQFWGKGEELDFLFERFNLKEILSKSVRDLSRGQRKFVTLLSTINKKRALYVFDEPLDLLDSSKKSMILREIKNLAKNSIVMISSHDKEIEKIATQKIILTNDGSWTANEVRHKAKILTVKESFDLISRKNSTKEIFSCTGLKYSYEDGIETKEFPSIKIGNNEIIGLVGDNASGKTTYLKLIAGTLISSNGKINEKKFSRFGFLSQNANRQLFGNTVYEELFIGINHISDKDKSMAEYFLDKLELSSSRNVHPIFLSGGQKQKLAFASLLMHQPEIILLDEITTNLDIKSINSIFELLSEYRKENDLAIVFTDQADAYLKKICDEIYFL